MKKTYAETLREARRLSILSLLAKSPAYEASEHTLWRALPSEGAPASADVVAGDLAWLEEQGLVWVDRIADVALATITRRGLDVASGLSRIPGVAEPLPGG